MVAENVGCLIVTRNARMVGIVTERDYLRKVIHLGKTSASTHVSEIATMGVDSIVVACVVFARVGGRL